MLLELCIGASCLLNNPINHMTCNINSCEIIKEFEEELHIQLREKLLEKDNIVYRLGCNGEYPCRSNGYDCSGLIDGSLRELGLYNGKKLNSGAFVQAGKSILKLSDIKQGQLVFWRSLDGGADHIAYVDSEYTDKGVWIIDAVEDRTKTTRRFISFGASKILWGKYKLTFVEIDYSKPILLNRKTGRFYQ